MLLKNFIFSFEKPLIIRSLDLSKISVIASRTSFVGKLESPVNISAQVYVSFSKQLSILLG
jgi:hypothetical protein